MSYESTLGRIEQLLVRGDVDLAQFECAKLVLTEPGNVRARVVMSNLYQRAGRIQLAVRYALEAKEKLNDSSGWQNVVAVSSQLLGLGEDEAAWQCMELIDARLPENQSGAADIARHFRVLGDHGHALEWFNLAEQQNLDLAGVTELKGMVQLFEGNLDIAAIELEKSISVHGNKNATAHWLISMLAKQEGADDRIARLKQLHIKNDFASQDRQYLNYALFRELDRAGHNDEAWQHLSEALQLRRQDVHYSSDFENSTYDHLISATSGLQPAERSPCREGATPIFVLGMPRTGTSLLEAQLGRDANIAACGELTTFRHQLQFLLDKRMSYPFDRSLPEGIGKLDFKTLGSRYLEKTAWRAEGKPFFIDKHPTNFNFAGLIAKALPEAKIINLVRHPMDACFSNLKEVFAPNHYTYSYTQEECANHYRNYRRLMAHWHQIAPGRIIDVAYEVLVADTANEMRRIQTFCGLEEIGHSSEGLSAGLASSTASTVQLREPIHRRNINGWHRYRNQLSVLESELKSESEDYEKTYLT